MARKPKFVTPPPPPQDPTQWILDNGFAEFVLMHTPEIKYMCLLGYTYLHGCKVFDRIPNAAPWSYKFLSLLLACTGGGILIPIFINTIPVPLAQDIYPIAILLSFFLHTYIPILRQVTFLSAWFQGAVIVLYEIVRASVVIKFLDLAQTTIAPSLPGTTVPIFGPILCGWIAGCGGIFVPLDRGLEPIRVKGFSDPMTTALVASTLYHFAVNILPTMITTMNIIHLPSKAHVAVSTYFILHHLYVALYKTMTTTTTTTTGGPSSSMTKKNE